MLKNFIVGIFGLLLGSILSYIFVLYFIGPAKPASIEKNPSPISTQTPKKEVLGFLPYWFLNTADTNYAGKITNLDYFSLTIDSDGTIQKSVNPAELEPGYYALVSGKADPFFESARQNNIKLSLTVFSGDQALINALISDPLNHADNLISDVAPIIDKYGFSDLNLDVESTGFASPSAQINYESFVSEVKSKLNAKNPGVTLSSDIIPVDFIREDHLTRPANIAKYLDQIVIMAYDFHSPSSFVTGPVAPLYGGGTESEFDTQVAVNAALKNYEASKILLGAPFYGYSWETLNASPRSAIVPSSAIIESNTNLENLLANCTNCIKGFDNTAQESYVVYKNDSGTYQQIFYPDAKSISSKIAFLKGNNLGGLAIWSLGYEATDSATPIFTPIQSFLSGH